MPSEMLDWFAPDTSREWEMPGIGEQAEAARAANVAWFVTRCAPEKSPLLGIVENKSYSSPQARKDIRRALWMKQDKKCVGCRNSISNSNEATLDHTLPQVSHGTDKVANLTVMCERCNREKANQLPHGLSPDDVRLEAYSLQGGLWCPPSKRTH